MALTADDSGRIRAGAGPSGNTLPPELAQLIAGSMANGGTGGGASAPPTTTLNIRIGGASTVKVDAGQMGAEGYGRRPGVIKNTGIKTFSSIDDAINSFFLMDDDYRANLMEKLYYYGLTDGKDNEIAAANAWGDAVKLAWNYRLAGKEVDPIDLLPRMTNLRAGQLGNAPRTVTQRSFNALDPEEAKAFIRQSWQAAMGRDPHDAEVRQLIDGLRQGFANNPSVVQQTTDADGNTTQRVLNPGFDQQAYIANQLQADPEARAHQAAGELFPALMAALKSP